MPARLHHNWPIEEYEFYVEERSKSKGGGAPGNNILSPIEISDSLPEGFSFWRRLTNASIGNIQDSIIRMQTTTAAYDGIALRIPIGKPKYWNGFKFSFKFKHWGNYYNSAYHFVQIAPVSTAFNTSAYAFKNDGFGGTFNYIVSVIWCSTYHKLFTTEPADYMQFELDCTKLANVINENITASIDDVPLVPKATSTIPDLNVYHIPPSASTWFDTKSDEPWEIIISCSKYRYTLNMLLKDLEIQFECKNDSDYNELIKDIPYLQ